MSAQNWQFLTPSPLLVIFLLSEIGNFWPPPCDNIVYGRPQPGQPQTQLCFVMHHYCEFKKVFATMWFTSAAIALPSAGSINHLPCFSTSLKLQGQITMLWSFFGFLFLNHLWETIQGNWIFLPFRILAEYWGCHVTNKLKTSSTNLILADRLQSWI